MKVRLLMFSRVLNFNFELNFSMLKVKTTPINAEGQNSTYITIKDMLKVRNASKHL